jgi:hypothetical protein
LTSAGFPQPSTDLAKKKKILFLGGLADLFDIDLPTSDSHLQFRPTQALKILTG